MKAVPTRTATATRPARRRREGSVPRTDRRGHEDKRGECQRQADRPVPGRHAGGGRGASCRAEGRGLGVADQRPAVPVHGVDHALERTGTRAGRARALPRPATARVFRRRASPTSRNRPLRSRRRRGRGPPQGRRSPRPCSASRVPGIRSSISVDAGGVAGRGDRAVAGRAPTRGTTRARSREPGTRAQTRPIPRYVNRHRTRKSARPGAACRLRSDEQRERYPCQRDLARGATQDEDTP